MAVGLHLRRVLPVCGAYVVLIQERTITGGVCGPAKRLIRLHGAAEAMLPLARGRHTLAPEHGFVFGGHEDDETTSV